MIRYYLCIYFCLNSSSYDALSELACSSRQAHEMSESPSRFPQGLAQRDPSKGSEQGTAQKSPSRTSFSSHMLGKSQGRGLRVWVSARSLPKLSLPFAGTPQKAQ